MNANTTHTCQVCQNTYSCSSSLYRHLRKVHHHILRIRKGPAPTYPNKEARREAARLRALGRDSAGFVQKYGKFMRIAKKIMETYSTNPTDAVAVAKILYATMPSKIGDLVDSSNFNLYHHNKKARLMKTAGSYLTENHESFTSAFQYVLLNRYNHEIIPVIENYQNRYPSSDNSSSDDGATSDEGSGSSDAEGSGGSEAEDSANDSTAQGETGPRTSEITPRPGTQVSRVSTRSHPALEGVLDGLGDM